MENNKNYIELEKNNKIITAVTEDATNQAGK